MKVAGIEIGTFFQTPREAETTLQRARRLDELSNKLSEGKLSERELAPILTEWRNLRKTTEDLAGLPDLAAGRALLNQMSEIERRLTEGLADEVVAKSQRAYQHAVEIKLLRAQIHGIEKLTSTHKTGVRAAVDALRTRSTKEKTS
jgi:hypothetical protein